MKRKARCKRTLPPFDANSLGPIEKIHHDLHEEKVTAARYHQAEEFIHACECVAAWRLKQGKRSEDAGFYLAELATRMAGSIRALTEAGDIMLARHLAPIVATMQGAENRQIAAVVPAG